MFMNYLLSSFVFIAAITYSFAQENSKKDGLKQIGRSDNESSVEEIIELSVSESLDVLSSLSALEKLEQLESLEALESLQSLEIVIPDFDYEFDYGSVYNQLYSDQNVNLELQKLDLNVQEIIHESMKSVEVVLRGLKTEKD